MSIFIPLVGKEMGNRKASNELNKMIGVKRNKNNPSPSSICFRVIWILCLFLITGQNLKTFGQCNSTFPDFSYSVFNDSVVFSDSSVDALSWYWDFGNSDTSVLANPTHIFSSPGLFSVCLTTSDSCSTATICKQIGISPGGNGFTPRFKVLLNELNNFTGNPYGYKVAETGDGALLWAREASNHIRLIKTDGFGNINWAKKINYWARVDDFIRLKSGDFMLVGARFGIPYLLKIDLLGNLIWEKEYNNIATIAGVRERPDGTLVLAGLASGGLPSSSTSDISCIMTDANGNIIWKRTYGTVLGDERCKGIEISPDGEFIYLGIDRNTNGGLAHVLKLDKNGNKIWVKQYNIWPSYDYYTDLIIDKCGSLWLLKENPSISIQTNFWNQSTTTFLQGFSLIKIDSNGNVLSEGNYGLARADFSNSLNERAYDIYPSHLGLCSDGNLLVSGKVIGPDYVNGGGTIFGDQDIFIAKFSQFSGLPLWVNIAGTNLKDDPMELKGAVDNGILISSLSGSYPYLYKLSNLGECGGEDNSFDLEFDFSWNLNNTSPSYLVAPSPPISGNSTISIIPLNTSLAFDCQSICTTSPTSGFTYVINGNTVSFTDTSIGGNSISWNFDNGKYSCSVNPNMTFDCGKYNVCQSIFNNCGWDSTCQMLDFLPSQLSFYANRDTICINDTITLINSTADLFAHDWYWNGVYIGNSDTLNYSPDSSGSVLVSLVANCSGGINDTISKSIMVTGNPLNVGNDTSICLGDTILLGSGTTFKEYKWSTGDTMSSIRVSSMGNYSLIAADSNGCNALDTIVVWVDSLPFINIGQDTSICIGSVLLLDAGNGMNNYSWSTGDTFQVLAVTNTGSYNVIVQGQVGCFNSDTIAVQMVSLPIVDVGTDTTICSGNMIHLSTGVEAISYQWSSNDSTDSIAVSTSGIYWVTVIDSLNCTNSDTVFVDTFSTTVGFSWTTNVLNVLFTDTSNSPFISSWQWDFGDGNISNNQYPNHMYSQPGNYDVCLAISHLCGADTVCHQVEVTCPAITASFGFITNEDSVLFSDFSSGAIFSWSWDFGDGKTSSLPNPVHIYDSAGIYQVQLIVWDSCNYDTISKNVTIIINGFIKSEFGQSIEVYPNPTSDKITIRFGNIEDSKIQICLKNILNQSIILREGIKSEKETICLIGLPDGIYFLSIIGEKIQYRSKVEILRK